MDFSKFTAVENSNTRKPGTKFTKVQVFDDLKYRKALTKKTGIVEGRFYISNARFVSLGLASVVEGEGDKAVVKSPGNGLRQFIAPDGSVLLGVVADKDAKILKASKRGGKTKGFKSTKLEAALAGLKVIDPSKEKVNQYITLTQEGENVEIHKVAVIKVFSMSVGAEKVKVKETPLEAAIAEGKVTETVASNPTPTPAMAPIVSQDW